MFIDPTTPHSDPVRTRDEFENRNLIVRSSEPRRVSGGSDL
jgi:hypothetical protein